jgi:hypothetical protein
MTSGTPPGGTHITDGPQGGECFGGDAGIPFECGLACDSCGSPDGCVCDGGGICIGVGRASCDDTSGTATDASTSVTGSESGTSGTGTAGSTTG